jgi:hypothetical protein
MTLFHDFTVPEWKVFYGNLLMLATCAFYISWWVFTFRPGADGSPSFSAVLIIAALFSGVAAIALLFSGISSPAVSGLAVPVLYVLAAAAVSYVLLLEVTRIVFHRPVTSELLVMIVWATAELAAIAALRYSGRFGVAQIAVLSPLVVLATFAGVVCYVLYYNLDAEASFTAGLIPLIVDAGVVSVFLAVQTLS